MAIITTLMKFLPKVVRSELKLVRFLKKKWNVSKKSLHLIKSISKSMISSKVNACEMQNLQGTWKFSWSSQAIYLTCKHLARNMEISITLRWNAFQGTWKFPYTLPYVSLQGTFPCTFSMVLRKKYTEISLYQCIRAAQMNMEISVNLHCCLKEHWRDPLSTIITEMYPF